MEFDSAARRNAAGLTFVSTKSCSCVCRTSIDTSGSEGKNTDGVAEPESTAERHTGVRPSLATSIHGVTSTGRREFLLISFPGEIHLPGRRQMAGPAAKMSCLMSSDVKVAIISGQRSQKTKRGWLRATA